MMVNLIAEFYLVDRGLRHRLPGFSSMGRLVILPFYLVDRGLIVQTNDIYQVKTLGVPLS